MQTTTFPQPKDFPFTVQDIRDAYAKLGAKPAWGVYIFEHLKRQSFCMCPLTVLAVSRAENPEDEIKTLIEHCDTRLLAGRLGIPYAVAGHFICGFDGIQMDRLSDAYVFGEYVHVELLSV